MTQYDLGAMEGSLIIEEVQALASAFKMNISFFFFGLFRATLRHIEVPRLRGRMRATAAGLHHTVTATRDTSHLCDLHHRSQ